MNNINCVLKEKNNCFGCRACFNICTSKAITMQEDKEGFFYPVVDNNKCTNCGLCKKACPSLNKSKTFRKNTKNPDCYAAIAIDDIRLISSSGGAFSIIADEIFRQGGVVCGVAYVGQKVQHIIIESPDNIDKLRGSKYVQSDTNTVYSQIKDIVKTGRLVLFTGTPCQVAGLNIYLGGIYPNLITVDLLCHGVPSQKVFDKYLEETLTDKKNGDFYYTSFRDKINGWGVYTTTTTTTGYKYYGGPTAKDTYLQAFINNMCLRPCCGTCPYTSTQREADITIADFWAIERFKPELNDGKGTSMILVHNEKGKKLFNIIKNKFMVLEKVPIEYAKYYNITLYTPLKQHRNRDKFFRLLNAGKPLTEIIKKCNEGYLEHKEYGEYEDKVDIAIFNLWPYQNYGGILNAYALQKTLGNLGYSSKLINWQYPRWRELYTGSFIEEFANKHLDITRPFYKYSDLFNNVNSMADIFIAGSDCIWSSTWFADSLNFLTFANTDKKKISYAPSFGSADVDYPNDLLFLSNKYYLSLFDNISVREDSGCKIVKEKFGLEATQVLDPTLLLNAKDYDDILGESSLQINNYIFNYCINEKKTDNEYLMQKLTPLGDIISYNQFDSDKKSVAEWLNRIKNSKLILTNSYHACCFALIFNIPFWIFKPAETDFSRFESLLSLLHLNNRIVYEIDKFSIANLFNPIDWSQVNTLLAVEKNRSLNWLKNALETPKDISKINPVDSVIHYLSSNIDQKISIIDLYNVLNYKTNYINYQKYRILRRLVFGELRAIFKDKQQSFYEKVKRARKIKSEYLCLSEIMHK
jgi:coenzyme F420-reducing hydrogenase beta subunit